MDNHDMKEIEEKIERLVIQYNIKNRNIIPDLIDIYEISNNIITIIDYITKGKHDHNELADKFVELQTELYHHMKFHLKSLIRPLSKLINRIIENIDDPDE